MTSKVKRKVTVENSKESDDQPRRPSVFERLGPGAGNVTSQPSDRHSSRSDQNEKCRMWLRTGSCSYGSTCRYKHEAFPSSSRRSGKSDKDGEVKDLRQKVKSKREESKEIRTGSVSPQRKSSKRSISRSRKGEHEGKMKSTVVVTRPRSPTSAAIEPGESKKKSEGNWEDDSDDWPMDAAQLDYKEELTLERKRQQLQRELELELQKERLLNENVTITKTVSFSESSSSSTTSDSGSLSSSSESSSSSSEEESNDSSSSTSSTSSSSSRPAAKKKSKKSAKEPAKSAKTRAKDDYDKIKSSRAAKAKKNRSPSPGTTRKGGRKGRDKVASPLGEKKRHQESRGEATGRSGVNVRMRGPRTPSPPQKGRKHRNWAQSSSADSRSADLQRGKGKRHKKKKDFPRSEVSNKNSKRKSNRGMTPPPLSSPNRTALMPGAASKKIKMRVEGKSRRRNRDASPPLLPRPSAPSAPPPKLMGTSRYLTEEKPSEKSRLDDRPRHYSRKDLEDATGHKRTDSHERTTKRGRTPPRKDLHRASPSPHKDRYDMDIPQVASRKPYAVPHEKEKPDRRRTSMSPVRADRRKVVAELEKKREVRELSPREHDMRRDTQYRSVDSHGYDKRGGDAKKRFVSPDVKKGRDDKGRDHAKERNAEYDSTSWQGDHRKPTSVSGRHTPETRGRQEPHSQPSVSRGGDRDQDRKKAVKKRDLTTRSVEDPERSRLPSPRRSQSPIHSHHAVREIESLAGNRGRLYDSDLPAADREYGYGYDSLRDSYLTDRLLSSEYESDVLRGTGVYSADVYSESRYRRGGKDSLDRYEPRDVLSPREVLPHRDIISLTARGDDYLSDIPLDDRSYDDRWPRSRTRDDWDPYSSLPTAPLPPHVAAALDEDRYGMPRRRRASPEWPRNRIEEGAQSHRPSNRTQGPSTDIRSRSPKPPPANRGERHDRRHDSRANDAKHIEDTQKVVDDRKGRTVRKDRGKAKEDSSVDDKAASKEKSAVKRPHSPSPTPAVKAKKRRNELQSFDLLKYHGGDASEKEKPPPKKVKEEPKTDSKVSSSSHRQKSGKQELVPPKTDNLTSSEKNESSSTKSTSENKTKDKEEQRKARKNDEGSRGEDVFSDISDDDDELLTREDFVETEGIGESSRSRHRAEENAEDSSRKRERHSAKDSQSTSKKERSSDSRTNSKDRLNDDASYSKDNRSHSEAKESDVQETLSYKEDTATDIDEYITAESVDYDPISDDELDALIEEPDETLVKTPAEVEKSKIVDALDVNWSTLMNETKTEFVPGFARRRFKAAHVLSRIGFSRTLAGEGLTQKVLDICQKQLDEEATDRTEGDVPPPAECRKKAFVLEHPLASFHVSISQNKRERRNIFDQIGPYRRALCARRDLQMRKLLCKPLNKLAATPTVTYTPQYAVVDKELYKQSLELLRKSTEPPPVNVC